MAEEERLGGGPGFCSWVPRSGPRLLIALESIELQ